MKLIKVKSKDKSELNFNPSELNEYIYNVNKQMDLNYQGFSVDFLYTGDRTVIIRTTINMSNCCSFSRLKKDVNDASKKIKQNMATIKSKFKGVKFEEKDWC